MNIFLKTSRLMGSTDIILPLTAEAQRTLKKKDYFLNLHLSVSSASLR
jgi:hypothetical protein